MHLRQLKANEQMSAAMAHCLIFVDQMWEGDGAVCAEKAQSVRVTDSVFTVNILTDAVRWCNRHLVQRRLVSIYFMFVRAEVYSSSSFMRWRQRRLVSEERSTYTDCFCSSNSFCSILYRPRPHFFCSLIAVAVADVDFFGNTCYLFKHSLAVMAFSD